MIVGTTQAESWRCRFPSRQTFQEAAAILNISTARLRVLLMSDRVQGAYKSGKMWLMPLVNGKPIIKPGKRGPAPRWRNPKIPAQTIIHVNTHIIKENHNKDLKQPVITVKKHCELREETDSFSEKLLRSLGLDPPTDAQTPNLNTGGKQGVHFLLSNDGISVSSGPEELETTGNKTESTSKNGPVNLYGHEVEILGGCRIVYSPDRPKYGAKVWIETLYDVMVSRWDSGEPTTSA